MRKCKAIHIIILSGILFSCLLGCDTQNKAEEPAISTDSPIEEIPVQDTSNMVDERVELLYLVFRLAGNEEFSDSYTEYQQKLDFDSYKRHDAVKYAAKQGLGYDAVFKFAVHIRKTGDSFSFIDNIDSLVDDGRWTEKSAKKFLPLLNEFYTDTKFAEFYQSNTDFYKAETQSFMENTYSDIDLEWFKTYTDPNNLRCIYSPSITNNNFGATVNEEIVYCSVSGSGNAIVHEFCHSFANPIAHEWYKENEEFKKWCIETVDPEKLPSYNNGKIIAGEYVTRAYNVLYEAEHGRTPFPILLSEKGQGFPYIEDVYAMITTYEKAGADDDIIEQILGVGYVMGEEQSVSVGEREIKWRPLTLEEPLPYEYTQTEVGNAFGSQTGDVLYLEDSQEESSFLLIDLGETAFDGRDGYRMYSRIPLK